MKTIKLLSIFEYYSSIDELNKEDVELIQEAYIQARNAYAPYSAFHVGAAIRLENKKIVGGSNQENASYPAGICAERVALSSASSLYPESKPLSIAIVVNNTKFKSKYAIAPCGICRQSINEAQQRYSHPISIIFPAENGGFYKAKSIESLLPLSFNAKHLPK